MCYVIPFTLPCCRRTYVSVTKMKDCPADWPKTKCPKELCFQIGSQADDRDEGTCWRCKAAEAGTPQEHRESLRPGIDSADVERFILTPEERRSQMEEDGFCWFCGHSCGCESCEPVRIEGVNEGLLGRNRPPPVNKRLKIKHGGGARPKPAASSSKMSWRMRAKGRPQTRSVSKQISRASSSAQSPPPDERAQRAFSPAEPMSAVERLQPKQEYAGYGDQSLFFGAKSSSIHSITTPAPGQPFPDYGEQSHLLDPRLFQQPSSYTPGQADQAQEEPLLIVTQLTNSHTSPSTKPEEYQQLPFNPEEHDLYGASPPRTQHLYPQNHGQPQFIDPQLIGTGQTRSSIQDQRYSQSHENDPMLSHGRDALIISQSYGQPQGFDPALLSMNQAPPAFPDHSYDQNYQHQTMSHPFHTEPDQQPYGGLSNISSSPQEVPNDANLSKNMLSDYNTINNTNTNTNNKRERDDEYEYTYLDVTRS